MARYFEHWLTFKSRWLGTGEQVYTETDSKWIKIIVKYSRLFTLAMLFQSSLFKACIGNLQLDYDERRSRRRRKTTTATTTTAITFKRRRKPVPENSYLSQLARSIKLQRAFASYLFAINSLYIWWLLMSLILMLLDLNAFEQYRYLDCFILGRFSVNARLSQAAKYVCSVIVFFILSFRLATIVFVPKVHLQWLEFIHKDLDSIEEHELCCDIPGLASESSPTTDYSASSHSRQLKLDDLVDSANYEDELMFAKSYCVINNYRALKLNRQPKHWFRLNVILLLQALIAIVYLVPFSSLMLTLMTPTIFTKLGFEMSYPNCVGYIRNYATGSDKYASIYNVSEDDARAVGYSKKRDMPVILPMDDVVSGQYHAIRVAFDYLTSMALYIDAMAFMLAHTILIILIYCDVLFNGNELRTRLVNLRHSLSDQLVHMSLSSEEEPQPEAEVEAMLQLNDGHHSQHNNYPDYFDNYLRRHKEQHRLFVDSAYTGGDNCMAHYNWTNNCRPPGYLDGQAIANETSVVQALILDHFKSTSRYNDYVSFMCCYIVSFWLGLTCIVLTWLGVTVSETMEYEFYIFQMAFTFAVLSFLICLSIIRTRNRAFYSLIFSVLAMETATTADQQQLSDQSRDHWRTILKYYEPKPMYCFTLMSADISQLLVVRLIAWTFSALFVVISFFHERLARLKYLNTLRNIAQ